MLTWWSIMVLAHNMNTAMKNLVLQDSWVSKRMKAVRFHLINMAGRVMEHARELSIRLAGGHPSFHILVKARMKIRELGHASG